MAEHYYTIKDIEEMTGIPATAIRFYDKRGLLVFLKRSPNGMRIFTDRDVEKIRLIQLLRNLDMPVNVISRYIGLVQQGDASRPERRRMIASAASTAAAGTTVFHMVGSLLRIGNVCAHCSTNASV